MSKKKVVLILELKAEKTKAILVDAKGVVLEEAFQAVTVNKLEGWVSYDPLNVIYSVQSSIQHVLEQAKTKVQVMEIGIVSDQYASFVWDKKTGAPYLDGVGVDCKRVETTKMQIQHSPLGDHLSKEFGVDFSDAPFLYHLNWFKENCENFKSSRSCFGTVESWVLFHLTGFDVFQTDLTHASNLTLLDLQQQHWDSFLVGECGIKVSNLPQLGSLKKGFGESKHFVPLADGVPIRAMVHRRQGMVFGADCLNAQDVFFHFNGNKGEFIFNWGDDWDQVRNESSALPLPTPEGRAFGFKKEVLFPVWPENLWKQSEIQAPPASFQTYINHKTEPLLFYPLKSVATEVSPMAIYGMTASTTDVELLFSYYESIIFYVREFIGALELRLDFRVKALVMARPAGVKDDLVQYFSDILQTPILCWEKNILPILGVLKQMTKTSSFINKKVLFLPHEASTHFHPHLDPLSAFARQQKWQDTLKSIMIS